MKMGKSLNKHYTKKINEWPVSTWKGAAEHHWVIREMPIDTTIKCLLPYTGRAKIKKDINTKHPHIGEGVELTEICTNTLGECLADS